MGSPRRSGSTRHDRSDRHDSDRPARVRAPSRGRSEEGSRRGGEGRSGRSRSRSRSPRRCSPSPGSPPAEERRRGGGGRQGHSRSRSPVEARSRSPSRERKRTSGSRREGGHRRRSSAGGRSRSRSADDSKTRERRKDSSRKFERSSRQHGERTSTRDNDDRGSSRRNASPPANGQLNQQRRRSPSPPHRRTSPSPRSNNPASRSDNNRPEFRRTRAVSSATEPAYRLSLSLPFTNLGSLLIGQSGWRAKEIKFYSGLTRLTFLAPIGSTASAELIGSKQAIKDGLWAIRKAIGELCKSDGIGPKCGNVDEWAGYSEDRIEDLGVSKAHVQRNSRSGNASASYAGGNRMIPAERSRPAQTPADERWNGPARADGGWNGLGSRDNFRPDERRPGGSAAQLSSWGSSRNTGDRFAAPNHRPQRPPVPERISVKSEEQIMDDELEALVQRRSPATDRTFSPVPATSSRQEPSTAASVVPFIDASSPSASLNAEDLGRRVARLAPVEREDFVRRFLAASEMGMGVFALSESSGLQLESVSSQVEKDGQASAVTSEAAGASLKRTSEEANGLTNLDEDSSKRLRRTEENAREDLDMQD